MASSRPIAAGEEYTPDDINNLRSDVLDGTSGHKHDGSDGAKVPFANLDVVGASGSTAPSGGSKSYNDLADHVASSQGAHGLPATAHVLGASAAARAIDGGNAPVSFQNGATSGTLTISFNITFDSPPVVVATPAGSISQVIFLDNIGFLITNITTTNFTIGVDWSAANQSISSIHWIAFGPKSS